MSPENVYYNEGVSSELGSKFVVPTLVGLFKNPPEGGTTNLFSSEKATKSS
jgi:hypothetical protein